MALKGVYSLYLAYSFIYFNFRTMTSLIDSLCELFSCKPLQLRELLNHPMNRERVNNYLRGRQLRTTHHKPATNNKLIKFGDLTMLGANKLLAYEGYCDRMTVRQHFYGRHRIRLIHFSMPCVVVYNSGGTGHNSYYPLEILTIAL